MAPASATQKPKDLKEKGLSRASSISKPESPVTDANGSENGHLKELQKYDSPRVNLVAWHRSNAQ
jgi:hypothetical protein